MNHAQLSSFYKTYKLSRIQHYWISICVMGIFITGTISWSRFEKFGLKKYPIAALSWMLRHSKIMWDLILICAVQVILPYESFNQIKETLYDLFKIRESSKHMVNRRLNEIRPAIYIRKQPKVVVAMS